VQRAAYAPQLANVLIDLIDRDGELAKRRMRALGGRLGGFTRGALLPARRRMGLTSMIIPLAPRSFASRETRQDNGYSPRTPIRNIHTRGEPPAPRQSLRLHAANGSIVVRAGLAGAMQVPLRDVHRTDEPCREPCEDLWIWNRRSHHTAALFRT
jgi:hypothetical protein